MPPKRKKPAERQRNEGSIFDDRRQVPQDDTKIVLVERRLHRFDDDPVWYLKASITTTTEGSDGASG